MELFYYTIGIIGGLVTVFKFIEYVMKFFKWLKGLLKKKTIDKNISGDSGRYVNINFKKQIKGWND